MVRVLNVTECLQSAGIESYIMNVYRNIDRSKVQFDFLVTRNQDEFYDAEIRKLGGRKFVIDRMKIKSTVVRVLMETWDMYNFLKKEKIEIMQVHSGTPLRVFYLIAAKKAGVKTRIYHAHSAEVFGPHKGLFIKKKIFYFLKKLIPFFATNMFACSKAAGVWMYPKNVQDKVEVINNGIIISKFKYNEEIRKKYRKEMEVSEKVVIGHVARFKEQKNHTFLIDVINDVVRENKNIELWLIGNGELEDEIKDKVNKLNLNDNVKFLGVRDDVNNLMQAMDLFVLPSNYEGLPVVGIEAQAAGLRCLFSTTITQEVAITPNVKFIDLKIDEWKNAILKYKTIDRYTEKYIKEAKYNIESTVEYLENVY